MKINLSQIARRSALFLVIVLGILMNIGSHHDPTELPGPKEGWNEASIEEYRSLFQPILLGYNENSFMFLREIFMGKNVRQFRLKLETLTVGEGSRWLDNLTVKVYSMPGSVYMQTIDWHQTQEPEGGFWTDTIPGNWAMLEITSAPLGELIDVGDAGSYLLVKKVAYDWDRNISPDFIPPSSDPRQINRTNIADATYVSRQNGRTTLGMLLNLGGRHYHLKHLKKKTRYAVYVSPYMTTAKSTAIDEERYIREKDSEHDVGLVVGISTSGFLKVPLRENISGQVRPTPGDTGVYYEIEPADEPRLLYLTVYGVFGHGYTISINELEERFNIVYEMSDGLHYNNAPTLPHDTVLVNFLNYSNQYADFIQPYANYLDRTREMIVLSSANMLAASEGHARQKRADIYKSEHWRLNTDVFLHQINDRAYASPTKINLFLDELDEPINGGGTMHHEWGHFEYGMDDEYHEDDGDNECTTIDHNSVMGYHSKRYEFCNSLNHVWRDNWDWGEADGESNWEILTDKYDLSSTYNYSHVQYHDVLHALEDLIDFNYYD